MNFDRDQFAKIFKLKGYSGEDGATLLLRTQLLLAVKNLIEKNQWSQLDAAKALGVAQPRIAEIYALRIDKFSVELLTKYLYRLKTDVYLSLDNNKMQPTGGGE